MKSLLRFGGILLLATVLAIWAGCSSSPTSSGYGRLQLMMVDSPSPNFDSVKIVVTKIEVHVAGVDSVSGWITISDSTRTYDLLQLRNGANALLSDSLLPIGHYTQIRLTLGDSCYATLGSARYPLSIPGGTKLKLNHQFSIESGTLYLLTLDFNASKSINQITLGVFQLKPVIRLVANVVSGTISGVISPSAAGGTVTAFNLSDSISTVADTSGFFKIMALPATTYGVTVVPNDTLYKDTTIAGVVVHAGQNTSLDTIKLTLK